MSDTEPTALTRIAARRLQQIARGEFAADVRAKASLAVVDVLGAICASVDSDLASSIRDFAAKRHGQAEAYAFVCSQTTDAETAAFTNAILAHIAIRDDMHTGAVSHIGSIVVPTVLAVGEREHWTGEQVIRGVIGGYEMGALLGTSLRAQGSFNPNFRPSGLIGAFAAAGAVACIHLANEEKIINALSLAVNSACGVNEWAVTANSEIFIHMGTAARSALTSCDLAAAGVMASETVLEGYYGFFQAHGVRESAAREFRAWSASSTLGTGVLEIKFKPAGCCNFTQTSTALAQILRRKHRLVPEEIETILVTTTTPAIKYPGCDDVGPFKGAAHGKMSIQYGVCAALALPSLDEAAWNPLLNPLVEKMAPKCSLAIDPAFDESYKQGLQPARVKIGLNDGRALVEEAGDVPWYGTEEVLERALAEMSGHVSVDRAKRIVNDCLTVGQLKDCCTLLQG